MKTTATSLKFTVRALIVILATAIAAAGLTITAGTAEAAYSSPTTMTQATYESQVQYYVNIERTKRGLPALTFASCPDATATKWASYLARTGQFFHQSLNNVLYGCNAYYAGETLAKGGLTPSQVVTMWMNSTTHRAVLLSPKSRRIGVGAVKDANGAWVVAANFVRF